MARELTLVRHAKSSWNDSSLSDFERPLNNRGFKDAPKMGKRLQNAHGRVDIILSSPAKRAITTAELIANKLDFNLQNIQLREEIYEANVNTLLLLISSLDNQYSKVMLIGHNPGFTMLCNYLCNANIDNMPTCSIVNIRFDTDSWNEVSEYSGELISFDYPKKLKSLYT